MEKIKKVFLFASFFTFFFFIFIKNLLNIVKVVQEIKNPPPEEKVQACTVKDINYFKKITNGDYLYALYRYKTLGSECEKK